jgi:hypothetical protein
VPGFALLFGAAAASCLPQSKACADYVKCQRAYDPTVDVSAYQEGGACWASPQEAAVCDDQCEQALDSLRQVPGSPADCAAAP